MAMTAEEMIDFFGDQADGSRLGMGVARSTANYHLAALNCRDALKCRLMQGLITWRLGRNPTEILEHAVPQLRDDWQILQEVGGDTAQLADTGFEVAMFVARLVEQPLPFSIPKNLSAVLESDRLLDAVLGKWLFGDWEADAWQQGSEQLERQGSPLAAETFAFYERVAHAAPAEVSELAKEAEVLFQRRKRDDFYSGGDQTEGGGPDNDFTVDYRFAALAKHVGGQSDSIHCWQW